MSLPSPSLLTLLVPNVLCINELLGVSAYMEHLPQSLVSVKGAERG